VDIIIDYFQFVESLPVLPDVRPGYLWKLLNLMLFDVAMKELYAVVVPDTTHWASPYLFMFFPTTNITAAITRELISSVMNTV
jgi:aromatic-L-amino-acid/L-tryptophan decarboxylase